MHMEALSITLATQMLAQMNSVLIFAVWFLPFQLHSVIDESRNDRIQIIDGEVWDRV